MGDLQEHHREGQPWRAVPVCCPPAWVMQVSSGSQPCRQKEMGLAGQVPMLTLALLCRTVEGRRAQHPLLAVYSLTPWAAQEQGSPTRKGPFQEQGRAAVGAG